MTASRRRPKIQSQSLEQPISLKNGRELIASYSLAGARCRKWIVFLTESGADFTFGAREELERLVGRRMASQFNFLVINKPGQSPNGTDKVAFEKSFRRLRRIDDALTTLKAIVPKSHSIYLIGYSEGAYLAPQIGCADKRVRAVAMIGGGTRGWLKEELSNASKKDKPLFRRRIMQIYAQPESTEKWNGFSYATWYSYRGDHTLRALRDVRVPMIAILGARDRVIDLKSAIVDLILVSERKEVQINIFGDCGHYFTKHWEQVSQVLGRFLAEQVER